MSDVWRDAMRNIANGEEVQQACDRASMRQTERVRQILRDEGREDLVAEMDANLRDVRLGVTQAKNIWHSISPVQRRVMLLLHEGRHLRLSVASKTRFEAIGLREGISTVAKACPVATVVALYGRKLVEPVKGRPRSRSDGALDLTFHYALTEHGRFVLKHGRVAHT